MQNLFGDLSLEETQAKILTLLEEKVNYSYYASETIGNYDYVAKENKAGAWYIMRISASGLAAYSRGESGIETAWNNKETLTYAKYSEVF